MMRRMLRLRGMPPHHRPRRRQVPPPKQALRSLLLPLLSPAPAHLRLVRQSPARSLVLLNLAPRNPVAQVQGPLHRVLQQNPAPLSLASLARQAVPLLRLPPLRNQARLSPARSLVLLNLAPRNPVRVTLLVALRSLVRPHSALVELVPVMAPQPPRKAALCRAPWPSQDRSLALVRRG